MSRIMAVVGATLLALVASPLDARQHAAELRVSVVDAETGRPIGGAVVRVDGVDRSVVTSADGLATIGGVRPGTHAVRVEALGYAAAGTLVTVEAEAIADITVRLTPEPLVLDRIEVDVRARSGWLGMVGFHDRREAGFGAHFVREELRERTSGSTRLSDAFRAIAGLRVRPNPRRAGVLMVESSRGRIQLVPTLGSPAPCLPRIWFDGVRLDAFAAEDINRIAGLRDIAAIEVYAGPAQVPIEFSGTGAACGVILLWTGDAEAGAATK